MLGHAIYRRGVASRGAEAVERGGRGVAVTEKGSTRFAWRSRLNRRRKGMHAFAWGGRIGPPVDFFAGVLLVVFRSTAAQLLDRCNGPFINLSWAHS